MMISDHVFINAVMSSNSLTDESKRSYLKHLRQVQKNSPLKIGTSFYKMLTNPEEFMKHILSLISNNEISLNTGKANIVALAMLIKRIRESGLLNEELLKHQSVWVKNVNTINQRVTNLIEKNTLSKREKYAWVDYEQWLEKEKSLRSSEEGSFAHLLIAFHSLVAPPRGGDLSNIHIMSSKETQPKGKQSVLIYDGPNKPAFLLLKDHKTSKTWPVIQQTLPVDLINSIHVSLQKMPRSLLFEQKTRSNFINWKNREFQRIFDKPVTSNIARHAFVNYKESIPRSIEARRKDANAMGHSLSTHEEYRKIN